MSKTKKRAIAIALAAVVLIGAVVGGTIAWLVQQIDTPLENTFTIGKVDIDLKEHTLDSNGNLTTADTTTNSYKFLPGDTLKKDPYVSVKPGSRACYLFVKAYEKDNSFGSSQKIIDYTVKTGNSDAEWHTLSSNSYISAAKTAGTLNDNDIANVWYCKAPAVAEGAQADTYQILTNDEVKIAGTITKENIGTKTPKLYFRAAAVQSDNLYDVAVAFADVKNYFNGALPS